MSREVWGGSKSYRMSWAIRKAVGEMKLSVRSWDQCCVCLCVNMANPAWWGRVETEQKRVAWCRLSPSQGPWEAMEANFFPELLQISI